MLRSRPNYRYVHSLVQTQTHRCPPWPWQCGDQSHPHHLVPYQKNEPAGCKKKTQLVVLFYPQVIWLAHLIIPALGFNMLTLPIQGILFCKYWWSQLMVWDIRYFYCWWYTYIIICGMCTVGPSMRKKQSRICMKVRANNRWSGGSFLAFGLSAETLIALSGNLGMDMFP